MQVRLMTNEYTMLMILVLKDNLVQMDVAEILMVAQAIQVILLNYFLQVELLA